MATENDQQGVCGQGNPGENSEEKEKELEKVLIRRERCVWGQYGVQVRYDGI